MSNQNQVGPEAREAAATPRRRLPGELLFSLLMLAGAGVLLHQGHAIAGFRSFSSAGVFPMLAAGAMVLSGIVVVAKTVRMRPSHAGLPIGAFFRNVAGPRVLFVVIMITAYLFALVPLGFIVSSTLFLAITICGLHRRNYLWMILLSVVSVFVIYLLFRHVFVVVLPQGAFV